MFPLIRQLPELVVGAAAAKGTGAPAAVDVRTGVEAGELGLVVTGGAAVGEALFEAAVGGALAVVGTLVEVVAVTLVGELLAASVADGGA